MELQENERIDDLEYKNLKIIQNKNLFCFGIDAILLSDFAKEIKKNSKVVDLGTGNGILGILLCGKTELSEIIGIEIQKESYELALRNIELNNLQDKFKVINSNIKDIKLERNKYDAIITNPPYKKKDTGIKNENKQKQIARHEIEATLEDFIKVSKDLLKPKGEIYIVHRPDRLVDLIYELRKNKLEPKKIKFIYPKENTTPNLVLIKAVKDGKPFLKIEEPLIVYNDDGTYTDSILKIYNKKEG